MNSDAEINNNHRCWLIGLGMGWVEWDRIGSSKVSRRQSPIIAVRIEDEARRTIKA